MSGSRAVLVTHAPPFPSGRLANQVARSSPPSIGTVVPVT